MSDDDNTMMSVGEIIEHIMKATGRSRKQAIAEFQRALKSGELQGSAINPATGRREMVSVDTIKRGRLRITGDRGDIVFDDA